MGRLDCRVQRLGDKILSTAVPGSSQGVSTLVGAIACSPRKVSHKGCLVMLRSTYLFRQLVCALRDGCRKRKGVWEHRMGLGCSSSAPEIDFVSRYVRIKTSSPPASLCQIPVVPSVGRKPRGVYPFLSAVLNKTSPRTSVRVQATSIALYNRLCRSAMLPTAAARLVLLV